MREAFDAAGSRNTAFERYQGGGETPGEGGRYIADPKLRTAVNTAIALERPLLLTGEAGTGKTMLAYAIASELGLPLETFQVRSDHRGRELLYQFDDMCRFFDAQVGDPRARDRSNYLILGPLGRAFTAERQTVVLLDEIDKAPRDFPNDLLDALDRRSFRIPAIDRTIEARIAPIVVVTSNRESCLPDPFLRRCVFHHIEFPSRERLEEIVRERLGTAGLTQRLCTLALARFQEVRAVGELQHRPATAELIGWVRVLLLAGVPPERLEVPVTELPHQGALLKTATDLARVFGQGE